MFCISGPNLVILAWMGDELSRGQARDWYTHTRTHRPTDAGDDNTRRPKLASGKNWPFPHSDLLWWQTIRILNSVPNYCQSVSPKQTTLEADPELLFNFMFMIWDSRLQDWQLFWLSFEHWSSRSVVTRFNHQNLRADLRILHRYV